MRFLKNPSTISEMGIKEKILFHKIDLFFQTMNKNLKKYNSIKTKGALSLRS